MNERIYNFHFRVAIEEDISQIQIVRNSVNENKLSRPGSISNEMCADYLLNRGKGWVCFKDQLLAGFAIADLKEHNIWALFIHPHFEGMGIAKRLHYLMLLWYFNQTHKTVWLSTSLNTRAETFYNKQGWKDKGILTNGERKFVLSYSHWMNL